VKGAVVKNPALDKLGAFKADETPLAKWAPNTAAAQKVFDRAGWR
jgi:iron(III) transport system substrate-binding protein